MEKLLILFETSYENKKRYWGEIFRGKRCQQTNNNYNTKQRLHTELMYRKKKKIM